MLSSRLWLSISALLLGLMSGWTLISLGIVAPLDPWHLSPYSLLLYGIAGLVPVVTWIYIFSRPRGSRVMIGSRGALSLSAFLIGAMTTSLLICCNVMAPIDLAALSTSAFTLFAVGHALPLLFWLTLIVASRGGSRLFGE